MAEQIGSSIIFIKSLVIESFVLAWLFEQFSIPALNHHVVGIEISLVNQLVLYVENIFIAQAIALSLIPGIPLLQVPWKAYETSNMQISRKQKFDIHKFFSNSGITDWTNMSYLFKKLYGNKIVNKEYKVKSRVFFSFLVFLYDWNSFLNFLALETVKNELEQKNVFASCTI